MNEKYFLFLGAVICLLVGGFGLASGGSAKAAGMQLAMGGAKGNSRWLFGVSFVVGLVLMLLAIWDYLESTPSR